MVKRTQAYGRFSDSPKRILKSSEIGTYDLSDILGHRTTFYFTSRCRAGFFYFRYFTGFTPEIVGFSKTALTFFMKLTWKGPKKSRNSKKMKFDTVEGAILHYFAIFRLIE